MATLIKLNKTSLPHLSDKFLSEEVSHLQKLVIDSGESLSKEVRDRIKFFSIQVIEGAGRVFPQNEVSKATKLIDNFSNSTVVGSPKSYNVNKVLFNRFITEVNSTLKVPTGLSLCFRLYVGKSVQTKMYNIVIVPICGLLPDEDPITSPIDHSKDSEKTFFANSGTGTAFFGFKISTKPDGSTDIGIVRNVSEAQKLIEEKDGLAIDPSREKEPTQAVYFAAKTLSGFFSGLVGNLIVNFSRLEKDDCLGLVLKDENQILYFDQGDLIPPPPVNDSFFV